MKANYHTHSRWCRHGSGEISDYIEEAVRTGLCELAITEHVVHRKGFSWIPWSDFLLYDLALNNAIRNCKEPIRLIKGFECEYYKDEMDDYRILQEQYGYELLFLGQHACGKDHSINVFGPKNADVLKIYADEVCEGLHTGLFRFLAHPDCVLEGYLPRWDKTCEEVFSQIFETCQSLRIPVEINANGFRQNRSYPSPMVWQLAGKYDLTILINSDAHHPEHLHDEEVRALEEWTRHQGLFVTETLSI